MMFNLQVVLLLASLKLDDVWLDAIHALVQNACFFGNVCKFLFECDHNSPCFKLLMLQ